MLSQFSLREKEKGLEDLELPALVLWLKSVKGSRVSGISWIRVQTDRKNGWELMRRMLFSSVERDEAGLFVFDTCKQFIETVPSIRRDARDMDDVDTDCEDHIADESRYRCMTVRYGLRVEQV